MFACPLALIIRQIPVTAPPVSHAIGNANYTGYPKFQDHLVSVVLLALCAGLAWMVARLIPVAGLDHAAEPPAAEAPRPGRAFRLTAAGMWLALLARYLPNLSADLDQLSRATFYPAGFDDQNFRLWGYLVAHGYLPFRDFWYTYSGFFAHLLPFPTGNLLATVQAMITLWYLYLALRYLFPRLPWAALGLFLFALIPALDGEFIGSFRYLLGIDVALLYPALLDAPKRQRRRQAWFASLVAIAFWYEPVQLLYASAGILTHIVLAAWPAEHVHWRAALAQAGRVLRQRAVTVALPAAIGILPVLLFLAAAGMLPGFLSFQLSLSDQSVYAAVPANVVRWTLPLLRFDAVFILLFFTLVLAFHEYFRHSRPPGAAAVALLVVSLAGLMTMQKQLVRPYNMEVVQIVPYVAALLYGICAWPRRTRGQAAVVAMFLGYVLGIAQSQGVFRQLYGSVLDIPNRLEGDLSTFSMRGSDVQWARISAYDPGRFREFVPENAVLQVLKREFNWTSDQTLYVLGDDSSFYILAGQKPPYVANNYNCSPLAEQRHVLAWLRSERPRFVVWNPVDASFDGVPHVVRLPVIYQYVVEHYRPLKVVGPYQILTLKTEPAETDSQYWLNELGSTIDLGHIPQLTAPSAYHPCPAVAPARCGTVLYIHWPAAISPGKAAVLMDSLAGPLKVQFDLVPGSRDYIIDGDRLWFRSFLRPEDHAVILIPQAELRQELRLRNSGTLY